jgi:hypothetical protein
MRGGKFIKTLLHFLHHSGVVQLVAHGPLEPRILVRVQAPEPLIFQCELRSYAAVTRALRADCAVRTNCFPRCDKYFSARFSKYSNSRGVPADFRDNWRAELRRAGLLRGGMGSSKPNLSGIAPNQGRKWARHYSQLARLSRGNEGLNRVTACAQIQRPSVVPA